jgi:hypothetical protein
MIVSFEDGKGSVTAKFDELCRPLLIDLASIIN